MAKCASVWAEHQVQLCSFMAPHVLNMSLILGVLVAKGVADSGAACSVADSGTGCSTSQQSQGVDEDLESLLQTKVDGDTAVGSGAALVETSGSARLHWYRPRYTGCTGTVTLLFST